MGEGPADRQAGAHGTVKEATIIPQGRALASDGKVETPGGRVRFFDDDQFCLSTKIQNTKNARTRSQNNKQGAYIAFHHTHGGII